MAATIPADVYLSVSLWRRALACVLVVLSVFIPMGLLVLLAQIVWAGMFVVLSILPSLTRLFPWGGAEFLRGILLFKIQPLIFIVAISMFFALIFAWTWGTHELLAGWVIRMTSRSTDTRYLLHARETILYLRPFSDDIRDYRPQALALELLFWPGLRAGHERDRPERMICEKLHRYGSFAALARPGELLPSIGALRINVQDSEWNKAFLTLLGSTSLVVFNASSGTPALRWEMEEVVDRVDPRRLVILLPFSESRSRLKDPAARKHAYLAFRAAFGRLLPCPLPSDLGGPSVLGFERDWTPIVFDEGKDGFNGAFERALSHVWKSTGVLPRKRPAPLPFRIASMARRVSAACLVLTFCALAAPLVVTGSAALTGSCLRPSTTGALTLLYVFDPPEIRRNWRVLHRACEPSDSRLDRMRVPVTPRPGTGQGGSGPLPIGGGTSVSRIRTGKRTYLDRAPALSTEEIGRHMIPRSRTDSLPR